MFLAPKSASYTENEIKGNARPHPGPLSHEREKHPPCLGIFMLCGATLPHGDSHRRLPFLNTPCQQRRPRKIVDRTGCNLENSPTFMLKRCFFIAALLATARLRAAETNIAAPDSLARPLSLEECIDLALKQNSAILKGQSDFSDLSRDVSGWNAGVRVSWDLFDGFLTKGKVQQTQALHDRAKFDVEDAMRRIELEVRTAHSQFIEAKEVLESQK